jgi:hypothetical protein
MRFIRKNILPIDAGPFGAPIGNALYKIKNNHIAY